MLTRLHTMFRPSEGASAGTAGDVSSGQPAAPAAHLPQANPQPLTHRPPHAGRSVPRLPAGVWEAVPLEVKDMVFNYTCPDALYAMRRVDRTSRALIDARQGRRLMQMKALRAEIKRMPVRTPEERKTVVSAMCNVNACLLSADQDIDQLSAVKLAYLGSTDGMTAIAKARDAGVPVSWSAFRRIPDEYIPVVNEAGFVSSDHAADKLHRALMSPVELPLEEGGNSTPWDEIVNSGMFLGNSPSVEIVMCDVLEALLAAADRQEALRKLMAGLSVMDPISIGQILDRSQAVLDASRLADLLEPAVFTEIPEVHRARALHSVSFIACYRHEERASILKMLMWSIDCYLTAEHRDKPLSNLIAGLGRLPEHERESTHFALLKRVRHLPELQRSELMCELARELWSMHPSERANQFGRHLFVIESLAMPARIAPLITLAQQMCRLGAEHVAKKMAAILALCDDKTDDGKAQLIAAMADDITFVSGQQRKDALFGMLCDETRKLHVDARTAALPHLLKQSVHLSERVLKANGLAIWRMIKQSPVENRGRLLSTLASVLPHMGADIATRLSKKVERASQALPEGDRWLLLSALLNGLNVLGPNKAMATAALTIFSGLTSNQQQDFVRRHDYPINRLRSSQPETPDQSTQALLAAFQPYIRHGSVWANDFSAHDITLRVRYTGREDSEAIRQAASQSIWGVGHVRARGDDEALP